MSGGRRHSPCHPDLGVLPARLLLALVTACPAIRGIEIWSNAAGTQSASLNGAVKTTALASHHPDDPFLYAENWTATELARARINLSLRLGSLLNADLAYEHRAQYVSAGSTPAGRSAFLPSEGEAPFRIAQLDRELSRSGDRFAHRHELDRAQLALHPTWGEVTIGRQAVGLGRGVVFSAVDLFSPFSPLEVDREWRRGIDAIRAEYRLSDTASAEIIAAVGESLDESAVIARIRGYVGQVDGQLMAGKRAEDNLLALALSAAALDAEVHGEIALFSTPERQPDSTLFGSEHRVLKALLGASYTLDIGNGLTVLGEYHYSGFGVRDIEEAVLRFLDPCFRDRYLRGDMQILGQHAAALQATYPATATISLAMLTLSSPVDGSGVLSPSLRWDVTDSVSLLCSVFISWGRKPENGIPRSEYGATAESLFLQLNLYF